MEGSLRQLSHLELGRLIADMRDELGSLKQENFRLQTENETLRKRIAELEGKHPTKRLDQPYSGNS